ncbi:MAG: lipase secretion chaperone [Myxococcota bacterium]
MSGWLWLADFEVGEGAEDAGPQVTGPASALSETEERRAANVVDGFEPEVREVPRPKSLEGTSIDGYFTVVDGRFVPDANAIRVFEYFLSARGEIGEAEIRALIEQAARAQVPPGEDAAVMALFDDYLRYREALADLPRRSSPAAYFDDIRELQKSIFEDDSDALFAKDNRLVEYSLARSAIVTDRSLEPEERRRRLDALDETVPTPLREMRGAMMRQRDASAVVEQMRRDGLGEEEVFDYRADEFGEEAAERLQALDARRAEWDARLDVYRAERDAIRARGLEETEEAELLDELRASHFEGAEILRVEALDRNP